MPTIRACLTAALLIAASQSAHAEWRFENGVAIGTPRSTNSTLEAVVVACGDPFQIELYSRDDGPVLPESGGTADYFYTPGKIVASVDDHDYPLVAAGSDIAVVLFSEGTVAENHLAPVDRQLMEAMRDGARLALHFDITPANAADGSPYETFAIIPLEGAGAVLGAALAACL